MPLETTSAHLFSSTKGCKGIQGAELTNNQIGGGLGSASHADTRFNHSGAASYGFDEKGAAIAHEMRGSYAAMSQNNDRQQCGGKKKSRRRTKKKRKKRKKKKNKSRRRKTRRMSRKRRPKRKKSKRKKSKRKKSKKRVQKGGSSISYSVIDNALKGNDARILGAHSMSVSDKNCGDNYNHFTGGSDKSLY